MTEHNGAVEAAQPTGLELPEINLPSNFNIMDLVEAVKAGVRSEMDAAVADIERRLSQAREIEYANATGIARTTVHAEDLNIGKHLIDGYTLTPNSPGAGKIAWASLHVVLLGVDYTIADGNTDKKYAWFVKPATGTTATLVTGDTLPTLGANDALIFINNAGVPISVLESSITYAIGPNTVGLGQLAPEVNSVLTRLEQADIAQQAALDGTITTYYQNEAPWPSGAVSPGGGNVNQGDLWYDSNDNGAYRWTGATPGTGVTANTWAKIADTDNSALAGLINTKVTTYVAATAPAAPAGGFTTGDLWLDTAKGNMVKRWSGTAWVDLPVGDAAITAVGGAKIGTGIKGENVSTGTVAAARIGAGVNGAVLTTATGAVGSTQIAENAVTSTQLANNSVTSSQLASNAVTNAKLAVNAVMPKNINAAFHMLY